MADTGNAGRNDPCPCGSGKKFKQCCLLVKRVHKPQATPFSRTVWRLADFIIVPCLIVWFVFEPNFLHGWVDYVESGQYLAPINRIFHGQLPFRDSYTLFGPLFLYIPAFLMLLFGKTIAVLRAHFHMMAILNVIIAYFVGRMVCKKRLFRYAIPFVLLLEFFHPFWSTRWGGLRVGAGLFVIAALIRYLRAGSRGALLIAGCLTSVGLLYSTDVGILSAATSGTLFVWLFLSGQRRFAVLFGDFLIFVSGFLVTSFVPMIYLAVKGAMIPYIQTAFWDMPVHHMSMWGHGNMPSLLEAFRQSGGFWKVLTGDVFKVYLPSLIYAGFSCFLLVQLLKRRIAPETSIVFLLTVYGLLLYVMSFRAIEGPQFQMALPPLIILMGWLLERSWSAVRGFIEPLRGDEKRSWIVPVFSVILLAICSTYVFASDKRYYGSFQGWLKYQRHKSDLSARYSSPAWIGQLDWSPLSCERCGSINVQRNEADEIDGVTQFLLQNTKPGEIVFAFPEHGIFNFLADRPGLSRFDIAGLAWTTEAWQNELQNRLIQNPPRYVVAGKSLSNLAKSIGREEEILSEVGAFLAENYSVIRDFSTVAVLERR